MTGPGNVRELQHSMLRTVLICDGEEVAPEAIELLPETQPGVGVGFDIDIDSAAERLSPAEPAAPTAVTANAAAAEEVAETAPADPWEALREELLQQIDTAMRASRSHPAPLGKWLTEDIVLAASDASDRITRRAADLTGLPESTFRRQLQKTEAEQQMGLSARIDGWHNVRPLVKRVVAGASAGTICHTAG